MVWDAFAKSMLPLGRGLSVLPACQSVKRVIEPVLGSHRLHRAPIGRIACLSCGCSHAYHAETAFHVQATLPRVSRPAHADTPITPRRRSTILRARRETIRRSTTRYTLRPLCNYVPKMARSRFHPILLITLVFLALGSAHRIEVDPGEKECFYETLQPQDRVRSTDSYTIAQSLPSLPSLPFPLRPEPNGR